MSVLPDQVTPFGGDFGGDFDGVVRFSTGTGDLGLAGLPPGIGILNVPANEVCELPESLDLLLEAPCECLRASLGRCKRSRKNPTDDLAFMLDFDEKLKVEVCPLLDFIEHVAY